MHLGTKIYTQTINNQNPLHNPDFGTITTYTCIVFVCNHYIYWLLQQYQKNNVRDIVYITLMTLKIFNMTLTHFCCHFDFPGLVFLIFRDETKKALLPNEITHLDTVRAMFVRSFPGKLTMSYLESPKRKIYILEARTNIYYQLEDLR